MPRHQGGQCGWRGVSEGKSQCGHQCGVGGVDSRLSLVGPSSIQILVYGVRKELRFIFYIDRQLFQHHVLNGLSYSLKYINALK